MYEEIVKRDNIPINMDSELEPLTFPAFIEEWRIRLLDHAFHAYTKCSVPFKKGDEFSNYKGSDLVVQRVIFR